MIKYDPSTALADSLSNTFTDIADPTRRDVLAQLEITEATDGLTSVILVQLRVESSQCRQSPIIPRCSRRRSSIERRKDAQCPIPNAPNPLNPQ